MERTGQRPSGVTVRDLLIALATVLGVNALGALPAVFVGSDTAWFDRPWLIPPTIVFPVVWTALFTLSSVALYLVCRRGSTGGSSGSPRPPSPASSR